MAQYDDRSGSEPAWTSPGFSLADAAPTARARDEHRVVVPTKRIDTDYLPDDLYVQLQDDDGRLLFDADGRPVMVRHTLQRPRTAVRGIYLILAIVAFVTVVNVVLSIIGLVQVHELGF